VQSFQGDCEGMQFPESITVSRNNALKPLLKRSHHNCRNKVDLSGHFGPCPHGLHDLLYCPSADADADAMVIRRVKTQQATASTCSSTGRGQCTGYRGANETRMNYTVLYGINLCEPSCRTSGERYPRSLHAVSPFSLRYARHTGRREMAAERGVL